MSGIIVENLSFGYGSKQALDDVSFSVGKGQFTALLGPNGAGKSTLFALLTRLFVTQTGTVSIAGHDIKTAPSAALKHIGVVFQQLTLDMDLTVVQNLRYFAALQGISGRQANSRIHEVLEQVQMAERGHEPVRKLNGGHRRRAEIARSLIHTPSVLLLDEPTVGLDPQTRTGITQHVHDLAMDQGLTVLWATHLADEVHDKDQLVILDKGRVRASGKTGDIRQGKDLATYFIALTSGDHP